MLPESIANYLTQAARAARTAMPDANTSLFQTGVLDSFSLVEFVALIEGECGIRVADAELRPENFETVAKIEQYIRRAQAELAA